MKIFFLKRRKINKKKDKKYANKNPAGFVKVAKSKKIEPIKI